MQDGPLLFIRTPIFLTDMQQINEESTSIFLKEKNSIENRLIANQLRFFARQTLATAKEYVIELQTREKIIGTIEHVDNVLITVQTGDQQRIIDGNEIRAIYKH